MPSVAINNIRAILTVEKRNNMCYITNGGFDNIEVTYGFITNTLSPGQSFCFGYLITPFTLEAKVSGGGYTNTFTILNDGTSCYLVKG